MSVAVGNVVKVYLSEGYKKGIFQKIDKDFLVMKTNGLTTLIPLNKIMEIKDQTKIEEVFICSSCEYYNYHKKAEDFLPTNCKRCGHSLKVKNNE